jgi:AcrR family transcriptional regulator
MATTPSLSGPPAAAHRTARERARAEVTAEIKIAARKQLAEVGAAALSLRAVSREVGMVSSAVYRYFASREDLLTALIIDAYDAVGERAEHAVTTRPETDSLGRWVAVCHAVRAWALENPHEYALVYGSPVPGYHAPQDTIGPATRVTMVLSQLLREAIAHDNLREVEHLPIPKAVREPVKLLADTFVGDVPVWLLLRGLMAWTYLSGAITFELFGQRTGFTDDFDALFAHEINEIGYFVGFVPHRR